MRSFTILCLLMTVLLIPALVAQEAERPSPESDGTRPGRGMRGGGGGPMHPEGPPPMGGAGMGMGGGRGMGMGMGRGGPSPEMRELLEQILIARISQRLELSDEETVLLVRRFSKFREELSVLGKERMERVKALRKSLKEGKDNPEIETNLQALLDHERKMMEIRTSMMDDAGIDLEPWQKASLYLFVTEFENEMRQLVHRAFEQQRGAGEGGGPRGSKGGMEGGRGGGRRGAPEEQPVAVPVQE